MNMGRGSSAAASLGSPPGRAASPTAAAEALASLVVDLQARGLKVEVPLERRTGGAGPSDSGMLWVGGFPITVPTDNAAAAGSPYVLKAEDDGYAIFEDGRSGWPARRPSNAHASTTSAPPTESRTGRSA